RRARALDDVRRGIYQSAIVMRDFLLAADQTAAGAQAEKWMTIRRQTDAALAECAAALDTAEAAPFRSLSAEVAVYWRVLELMSELNEKERRARGNGFFPSDLVRRR